MFNATTESWLIQHDAYKQCSRNTRTISEHITLARKLSGIGLRGLARDALEIAKCVFPTGRAQLDAVLASIPNPTFNVVPEVKFCDEFKHLQILYIPFPCMPDYGLDTIYDGLRIALGPASIFEYPYKASFHGESIATNRHDPCVYDNPTNTVVESFSELESMLNGKEFDFVLYTVRPGNPIEGDMPRIAELCAANGIPLYAVDQEDNFGINYSAISNYGIKLYFKREMMMELDYPTIVKPMPFSYQHRLSSVLDTIEKSPTMFWCGQRSLARKVFLECAGNIVATTPNNLDQDQYTNALIKSSIGLNLYGWGIDTIRYYEVPFHRVMLMTQPVYIHLPNKFENGATCCEFVTPSELRERRDYYLSHPDELIEIANAGYKHALKYHTTYRRACELLSYVNEDMNGRLI